MVGIQSCTSFLKFYIKNPNENSLSVKSFEISTKCKRQISAHQAPAL
ncbi:hypothetical protein ELI_4176 [Eubacterium callanderi]|uniref:Uncharacterized protein n=1 Tax=Eubacterium callanderi TaxID=53442 RepID=E3GQ69_9FIRM|nr:hypothetical protein ELI_4176 [Eubacterium callanderi]